MKTILMSIIVSFLLIGCSDSTTSEENFKNNATDFYVLMLQTGEKTAELDKVYEDFLKYDKTDDELYINVVGMYVALNDMTIDTEVYRQQVTRLLNE